MMVQVSECSQGSQTIIWKIIVSPQIHKTAQQMEGPLNPEGIE